MSTETPDQPPTITPPRLPRVPEHRHSIWYYFGGLSLFLLLLMAGSGLLLSVYYEPSAYPAIATDGSPLALGRVMKDVKAGGQVYHAYDLIVLPLDTATGEVVPHGPLKGAIETLKENDTNGRAIRPSMAWASVEGRIMHDVEFGALIRSIHRYSADLLIASVVIHMFSAFFMRAYRRRKGLWLTGLTLLGLLLGSAFTGHLLPWNIFSYFSARIGTVIPEMGIPWIGPATATALRGGADVGPATLTRAYAAHTMALPLALLAFTATHLLLVGYLGLESRTGMKREGGMKMAGMLGGAAILALGLHPLLTGRFDPGSALVLVPLAVLPVVAAYMMSAAARSPMLKGPAAGDAMAPRAADEHVEGTPPPYISRFIYRDFLCWTIALGVVITLAVTAPWRERGYVGTPVTIDTPLFTPYGIHPAWYFMFAYQFFGALDGAAPLLASLIVAGIWAAVPWLDRSTGNRSKGVTAIGITLLVLLTILTMLGYLNIPRAPLD